MPCDPPVTIATFPSSFTLGLLALVLFGRSQLRSPACRRGLVDRAARVEHDAVDLARALARDAALDHVAQDLLRGPLARRPVATAAGRVRHHGLTRREDDRRAGRKRLELAVAAAALVLDAGAVVPPPRSLRVV